MTGPSLPAPVIPAPPARRGPNVAKIKEEASARAEQLVSQVKATLTRRGERLAETRASEAGQEATTQAKHRRWMSEGVSYVAAPIFGALDGGIGRWRVGADKAADGTAIPETGVPINPSLLPSVLLRCLSILADEDSDLGAMGRGAGSVGIANQLYVIGDYGGAMARAELGAP